MLTEQQKEKAVKTFKRLIGIELARVYSMHGYKDLAVDEAELNQITRTDVKLNGYGIKGAVSSDVIFRRQLKQYFQRHASNILWLDICAPIIKGFYREKLWLVLTGGFHTVRVLSWLKREMELLI